MPRRPSTSRRRAASSAWASRRTTRRAGTTSAADGGILRVGTRGSALARAQAELVGAALRARYVRLEIQTVVIRTSGDRHARGPLPPSGLKGLFVKEIEEALLAGAIDVGVHSMKDLPVRLAPGLVVGAVPARADPRDVLVGDGEGGIRGLPRAARVGTASVRRRAQLLARRRDLVVVPLRGNVDTRLDRWRNGELDALVLAAAGLERLGVRERRARPLPPEEFVPAVGQGALALECRDVDVRTRELLAAVADATAEAAVAAERSFLTAIGGDCNTPLAAHATVTGGRAALRALVTDADGARCLEDEGTAPVSDAAALGRTLAERLLVAGAARLLAG